jgi:hypothetical protein
MKTVELTIYLFGDSFLAEPLAVCRIEVVPLQCLYSQTKAGVQHTLALSLPVGQSRMVQIFSNSTRNAYRPRD